jgi:hypothetical protein
MVLTITILPHITEKAKAQSPPGKLEVLANTHS